MHRWDLFAYATTDREGLGNAVSEAMAFGLPCILSDVGPMREFVGPDNAARLFRQSSDTELAEAIISLVGDFIRKESDVKSGAGIRLQAFRSGYFARRSC